MVSIQYALSLIERNMNHYVSKGCLIVHKSGVTGARFKLLKAEEDPVISA